MKRVHACDVWHFFGSSLSRSKKNDHVFYNACLEEIVRYYQGRRKLSKKATLTNVNVWTDNCGDSICADKNSGRLRVLRCFRRGDTHQFSQKYDFKGVWDAAGKVVKSYTRNLENEFKARFANPWMCYVSLRHGLATVKSEAQNVLGRSRAYKGSLVTKIFFGFVTDDPE
jgi:hypothetical protein